MKLFNSEFSKISEAALVLGFFTFLSQVLAIFRDRFFAGTIGTGSDLDIYYAAFRVPDLIFTFGAALVSVSILMPFLKTQLQKSHVEGQQFIHQVFTTFFASILLLSFLAWLLMPWLSQGLFPGFHEYEIDQVVSLSRVMLLSPIILGVSNLFATITQSFKKFFVYAIAPVFYALGIILGIVLFYPMFGLLGLGYGVILGALMHMGIQLPVVIRHGLLPRFTTRIDWSHIGTVIKHSLPRTITLSMSKIVFLVFVSLASALIPGTISVFNLSYNLQSVPLAIIGVSYSVAAFPVLVDFFNSQNYEKFISHVMVPIRQIVFWSLPITTLFIVLRAQIVRVILGTGNFDWTDTRLTAASLALFIISVVAQSIVLLLVRAYYASGRTWKPLWITLSSSLLTIVFAYVFIDVYQSYSGVAHFFESLLRIENVAGSSVIMLSLAYSMGMFINLLVLVYAFKKDFPITGNYGMYRTFWQSLSASLLMGMMAYLMLQITDPLFSQETTFGVLGHGMISGFFGIVIGVLFLFSVRNEEIRVLRKSLHKKFSKITISHHGQI